MSSNSPKKAQSSYFSSFLCLLNQRNLKVKEIMPKGEPSNGYSSSSSGEEDGDAAWRAAIDSISGTTSYISSLTNGSSATKHNDRHDNDRSHDPKNKQLKHYQLKAQKLLDDILEKTIEIVKEPVPDLDEDPKIDDECCIRLFKHSQPGKILDQADEPEGPKKRPRLLPGEDIDEKSKKFRRRIRSVAVDGNEVMAAANDAYKKSLARVQAKDAAAKAAAKREEERVANLKKIRGERWLPSMAKEMKVKSKH